VTDRSSRSFAVGLVSALALAIIAVGVFLVGSEQRLWEGRTTYRLKFTRTNGLQEGAPVALDGVNIGSVSRMRFPSDPTAQYVAVEISLSSNVAPRIRRDSIAKIQTLGMLGDKYIEITSGTLQAPQVEPNEEIKSVDPVDYSAILDQSGDIVTNAIEVTALLRKVLTDINEGEGLVGRLVGDRDFGRQFADDLSLTIANIESATKRVDDQFAKVERGEGALGSLLSREDQVRRILDNVEDASAQVASFSRELNEGQGTVPRLVHDRELADVTLSDVHEAAASISDIAAKVRSGQGSLGKLVYDDTLYDGAASFVSGSSTGGFWRLLGRFLAFFWPFSFGNDSGSTPAVAEDATPADAGIDGGAADTGPERLTRAGPRLESKLPPAVVDAGATASATPTTRRTKNAQPPAAVTRHPLFGDGFPLFPELPDDEAPTDLAVAKKP
jgi:phospholipid/cholesterol/gamma-HCH transport system substrate-binding protein